MLITGTTWHLVPGLFVAEERGVHRLRGIPEPVSLYRVLQPSGTRGRLKAAAAHGLTPFVGRQTERALLRDRWERTRAGQGQLVVVTGEPGIGKSRLLHVFREDIADREETWVECAASPYHESTPFFCVMDMLQQALAIQGGESEEQRLMLLERALATAGLDLREAVPLLAGLIGLDVPPDRYPPLAGSAGQQRRRLMTTLVRVPVRDHSRRRLTHACGSARHHEHGHLPSALEHVHRRPDGGCDDGERHHGERQPARECAVHEHPAVQRGRESRRPQHTAMFANGSLGAGGPFDAIVTLNSAEPFKFTRPPSAGQFDALRTTEHEMDEALGLGSGINVASDLRPQDLFSWSAPGTRNVTSGGSRYFSIDGGTTNIVGFNQNPSGDFGDWLSGSCPQATPYVQNAFACANQASDVTQTSPEGVNLDVVGYDLITGPTTTTTTTASTTTTTIVAAVGHLKCYKTKDPRPKAAYTTDLIANAAGFPNTLGCSLKLGAKRVCVEVGKQNVAPLPPGGGPVAPPDAGSVFLSYKIKCSKQVVPPAAFVDQFGAGSFTVGTPSELLVPALPGPANDHFECYKVRDARPKATYTMDLIAGVAGFTNELGCSSSSARRRPASR